MVVADPNIIKDITTSRARFPKAVHMYEALNFFGRNIISSEGEEWKKFRKICAPAFNDVSVIALLGKDTNRVVFDRGITRWCGMKA